MSPKKETSVVAAAAAASAAVGASTSTVRTYGNENLAAELRTQFYTGKTLPYTWRIAQLQALRRCVFENADAFRKALWEDLSKPVTEVDLMEINMVFNDIDTALDNLYSWMKPEYVSTPLINKLDGCQIRRDPLGVVLIISPWNYPLQLCLVPLVGVIAAGNCCVIKPSEVSPSFAKTLAETLPAYLDNSCFRVVLGEVPETTELLAQCWDHIFYTGGEGVAKIVMGAASKHLTPVTLELGGKSPTYVDGTTNMATAAKRIMWGRTVNCGQTCISPDYVLVEEAHMEEFLVAARAAIEELFGSDPQKSDSYSRIVNTNHVKRIARLLEGAPIYSGGTVIEADKYVAPTLVRNPSPDSPVMRDEIFGPVLSVIPVRNHHEAISFINSRPKPLALYVFSNNTDIVEDIIQRTSSGSLLVNDTIMQVSVDTLPFGGVGKSGMGAYHGKSSFDLFSHKKSIMVKPIGLEFVNKVRYPPYTERNLNVLKFLLGWPKSATHKIGTSTLKIVLYISIVILFYYMYTRYVLRTV